MATRALHLTFVLLRRVIWTGALMAALYFAVLLAVDAIPGVEVDTAHYFVGRIVLQKAGGWAEAVTVRIWGDQTVLRWRAEQTIAQLEHELEQLQWLEAQAATWAAALETKLAGLERNLESTRAGLTQLAAIMESRPAALVVDGATLHGAQIETYATQRMLEFSVLQEQLALYQQSHRAYVDAALQARTLWMEARQNVKVLHAHLALIDATLTLERTRDPDSAASQNVRQLNARLSVELLRNQRIAEARQRLENGLSLEPVAPDDLGGLLDRSVDLARDLRAVSSTPPP